MNIIKYLKNLFIIQPSNEELELMKKLKIAQDNGIKTKIIGNSIFREINDEEEFLNSCKFDEDISDPLESSFKLFNSNDSEEVCLEKLQQLQELIKTSKKINSVSTGTIQIDTYLTIKNNKNS